MHRIYSGNDWLAILSVRKFMRDHCRSHLLVQEAFVLSILCIHLHKISIPGTDPASPRCISIRFGSPRRRSDWCAALGTLFVAVNLNALVSLHRPSWITLFLLFQESRFPGPRAFGHLLSPPSRLDLELPLSMGSRPRLPAAAAPRLNGSPGDYQMLTSVAPALTCGPYESETILNRQSFRDLGIPSRFTSIP